MTSKPVDPAHLLARLADIVGPQHVLTGLVRGAVAAAHEIALSLEREWPAYRRFVFGHLGDGNLHIIAAGPPSAELALTRKLKQALDPKGILNPGRVLPD